MNKPLLLPGFICIFISLCVIVPLMGQPENDQCENATQINGVISDMGFVCVSGSNLLAEAEPFNNSCGIGEFPTVWYKIQTDGAAEVMSIHVKNADFEAPTINLFRLVSDCYALQPVGLTVSQLPCIIGSAAEAEAMGTQVGGNEIYYIAVSSFNHAGGDFDLCISLVGDASLCVVSRNIEIVSRSEPGPLEGPFYPGETVHICMNVNEYTAAGNGCQWFQGMIPVFGNGWDPASFDNNGQPLNATVNGLAMGDAGNGNYGSARWDWFTDVGYHHTDYVKQILDLDGNGSLDMCNLLYESDCPDLGGITGGCCGPCWEGSQGDLLPGGWFAYGINGTCEIPGPPIKLDWGDGNTCGSGMGPWKFCFDLITREYPQCQEDPSTVDLSLKFFTTADGETGSWSGNASVCALDQPAKLTLPYCCCDTMGFHENFTQDNNLIFEYPLTYESVDYFTWKVNPTPVMGAKDGQGFFGASLINSLYNPTQEIQTVTYQLNGYRGACMVYTNTLEVNVLCNLHAHLEPVEICGVQPVTLSPVITGCDLDLAYAWSTGVDTTAFITIDEPQDGLEYCVTVTNKNNGEEIVSCVVLIINDLPLVDLGPDTIYIQGSALLDAGNNGVHYLWNTGDTTAQIEVTATGMYSVTITDARGCSGSDAQFVEIITGVIPIGADDVVAIYPNPTNGILKLRIAGNQNHSADVSVYAPDGTKVYRDLYSISLQERTLQLDQLPKGLYYISVEIGEDTYWGRIVLQ